jgi:hypothetical protein
MPSAECELPRTPLLGTSVNKTYLASSTPLVTVVCNKNHSFGGCVDPSTSANIPCSHDIKGGGEQQVKRPDSREDQWLRSLSSPRDAFLRACVYVGEDV